MKAYYCCCINNMIELIFILAVLVLHNLEYAICFCLAMIVQMFELVTMVQLH